MSLSLQDIRAVDTAGTHTNQHLAGTGHRLRTFTQAPHFGRTKFGDFYDMHDSLRQSSWILYCFCH